MWHLVMPREPAVPHAISLTVGNGSLPMKFNRLAAAKRLHDVQDNIVNRNPAHKQKFEKVDGLLERKKHQVKAETTLVRSICLIAINELVIC
jgi:hypothetical protein